MKTMRSYGFAIVAMLLIFSVSCEKDEGFTRISEFEQSIQNAINKHRESEGLSKLVLNFLAMNDAQEYSSKLANETVPFGTEGINNALETLRSNLGADAAGVWVAYCEYENADSVLSIALDNQDIKELIEGDFNLSAVGAKKNSLGHYCITNILFRKP